MTSHELPPRVRWGVLDRGSQYTANDYLTLLKKHGVQVSRSNKGDPPYDNAMMESFFSTLRAELTDLERFATRQVARSAVFEFIEVFYNRQRLPSILKASLIHPPPR